METKELPTNGRKAWHVPAAPIVALIEAYITHERNRQRGLAEEADVADAGIITELAIAAGISERGLWRVRKVNKFVDFDTADKLMCAMGFAGPWPGALRPLYLEANLAKLDESRPCTTRRRGGGRKTSWPRHTAELMHRRGASYDEIAHALSADREQVAGFLRRNDLVGGDGFVGKRTWDYEEAYRLKYEEGWTAKQVAEKYGVSTKTVETTLWRIRHGRQPLRRGGEREVLVAA